MTELYARLNEHNRRAIEEGRPSYTLFVKGYGYSFGSLYNDRTAGTWKPSCISRRDIGLYALDCPTFTDRAAALAWIRAQYEAALGVYHADCAKAFAAIAEGLSPIKATYSPVDPDKTRVVVRLIFDQGRRSVETPMTVQEAITALDHLYDRAAIVPTILGAVIEGDALGRTSYADWTIPAGSNDYHLCGWRSTTGLGRYGCASNAA